MCSVLLRTRMLLKKQINVELQGEQQLRMDGGDWIAIAVIAAVAAMPRLLLLMSLPPLVHPDSDSYFTIAESLWAGEGFGDLSRRTPLYPLFLWATERFPQIGLLLTVVVQHLLGVGTAVLFYVMARRMFATTRIPAMLCGLATGLTIYPAMLEQSVLSEPLYTFLIAAAVCGLHLFVLPPRSPKLHGAVERAQVQPLHGLVQEETHMILAQHLAHAGRQQIGLLRVIRQKFHRASLQSPYTRPVKGSFHTDS